MKFLELTDNSFDMLMGKPIWGIERTIGTFLNLEFGNPRLQFREPKTKSESLPSNIARAFTRRRVFLKGEWSLWVEDCHWKISSGSFQLSDYEIGMRNQKSDYSDLNDLILDLNGQILTGSKIDFAKNSVEFKFDLGAIIQLECSQIAESTEWNLFHFDNILYCVSN